MSTTWGLVNCCEDNLLDPHQQIKSWLVKPRRQLRALDFATDEVHQCYHKGVERVALEGVWAPGPGHQWLHSGQ